MTRTGKEKNTYLIAYYEVNDIKIGETAKTYEYMNWIDRKHDIFRKEHGIPDHKMYNAEEQKLFNTFLDKFVKNKKTEKSKNDPEISEKMFGKVQIVARHNDLREAPAIYEVSLLYPMSREQLIQAVKDACLEYLESEEAKKKNSWLNDCFNWGDFYSWVPNKICKKHGFLKECDNDYYVCDVFYDEILVERNFKPVD